MGERCLGKTLLLLNRHGRPQANEVFKKNISNMLSIKCNEILLFVKRSGRFVVSDGDSRPDVCGL